MALKLKLDSLEGLPDDIAAEYTQQDDGSFLLQTISVDGLVVENVDGLKNTISTLRTTERELRAGLKRFEAIEDPKAAIAAMEKVAEMDNWDKDEKVQQLIEHNRQQMAAQHTTELKKANEALEQAESSLEATLIRNAAISALQKEGGKINLLLPHVLNSARMRKVDGKYHVEVVDDSGNPKVGNAQGDPMTIEGLVAEMKSNEDFAPGFAGSGSSGSGTESDAVGKTVQRGNVKVIAGSNQDAINANLEDIASGKVQVDLDK